MTEKTDPQRKKQLDLIFLLGRDYVLNQITAKMVSMGIVPKDIDIVTSFMTDEAKMVFVFDNGIIASAKPLIERPDDLEVTLTTENGKELGTIIAPDII